MSVHPVLINGRWRDADSSDTFNAFSPATGEALPGEFPVSNWSDINEALDAAAQAASQIAENDEPERLAQFLDCYAGLIEQERDAIVSAAHQETGLAREPRLAEIELPRTTGQLRQAAEACRNMSWAQATIDTKLNIRSYLAPIGPVCVMGPNNFPLAFGSASGGDFAAAIAAGNPVIGKAHPAHPDTTRIFAELARRAVDQAGLPAATLQLIYHMKNVDGERLVADARLGATGFTGSRKGGLALKRAADAAGKPIYLEMSSLNPVVVLPGALEERAEALAEEYVNSCLMAAGQFCTKPGLLCLVAGAKTETFLELIGQRFAASPAGPLLTEGVPRAMCENIDVLKSAGAEPFAESAKKHPLGYYCPNVAMRIAGSRFLESAIKLQTEVFGNACLAVIADDVRQLAEIIEELEGNLTGCVCSATDGRDDPLYDKIAPGLRQRVGRLLNDKMPTGVAVSPAMNHGGPFPSTGHPGFTSVGIPASMRRFALLQCFDNVRPHRLPRCLSDKNPTGHTWRYIDSAWSCEDL